ncbi:MAG: NUDIX domain-containing protein [Nanoarchaeota archaeon]|nr:NUDIX domain-containing protein [Nanoarchaeota archaeon]
MPEIFDLVDENNRPTGKTATREQVHKDPSLIHRAAYVFVINDKEKLYIKRRSLIKDLSPLYWEGSASGHVETGDSYEDTAMKELQEETGITGVKMEMLGDFKLFIDKEREWHRLFICHHNGPITLNEESSEGRFASIDGIKRLLEDKDMKFTQAFRKAFKMYLEHLDSSD